MSNVEPEFHRKSEFEPNELVFHAHETLNQVIANHQACVVALKIFAGAPHLVEQFEASYKALIGFDQNHPSYKTDIEEKRRYASYLVSGNFVILRNSTLVALMGALEGFVKVVAADLLKGGRFQSEKLTSKRFSVLIEEFLEEQMETRVAIAVGLLLDEKKSRVRGKASQYVSLLEDLGLKCSVDRADVQQIDDAYRIRNRIAHVGNLAGITSPETLGISEDDLRRYLVATRQFASEIYRQGGYTGL